MKLSGIYLNLIMISIILLSSCSSIDFEEELELFREKAENSHTPPDGGNCDPYAGPTGDIQSDAFCQAAWNDRCYGQDSQADKNCAVYKSIQEDNPGMPDCPYCP